MLIKQNKNLEIELKKMIDFLTIVILFLKSRSCTLFNYLITFENIIFFNLSCTPLLFSLVGVHFPTYVALTH